MNYSIYSDFSDTIAKPSTTHKFPPFEIELSKIISQDIKSIEARNLFLKHCNECYQEFLIKRRDNSIKYEDRMKIWLKPFNNLLTLTHIAALTENFELNFNFLQIVMLLKNELKVDELKIVIASGTLWQIIESFIQRQDVSKQLTEQNIKFDIKAAKLMFNNDELFNGDLYETDSIAYSNVDAYPKNYLIIGDNQMENYGFEKHLLNVQELDIAEVKQRINGYLSRLEK